MLPTGERIGRYEVIDRIGQGGLASVYRVRHVDLDSIFALKLLEVHRPHLVARLLEEGRAQATLFHPNVVRVNDVLLHQDLPVLVMEFVDGPSLDRYLVQRGRLDLGTALHLAIGITRGLRAAHARGLIHRDIKPGNVLLAEPKGGVLPKLADFGLVKVLHEDWHSQRAPTRTGVAMGTPEFMAPEQIRDAANVDPRADLYSLGVVLYLMLVGKLPFAGSDLLCLHEQIAAGAYLAPSERVPGIPPALDRLVVSLLRADPRARPSSCDEVLEVLQSPGARVPVGPSTVRPADLQAAAKLPCTGWTRLHGPQAAPLPQLPVRSSRLVLGAPLVLPVALAALGLAYTQWRAPEGVSAQAQVVPAAAMFQLPEPDSVEIPFIGPLPVEIPSKPAPVPRRPPAPAPRPPSTLVTFSGEASRVWLVQDGRRRDLPGRVRPGEYQVVALFPSTAPVAAGKVRIGSQPIELRCSSFALRCRP
jgi:hypothetical protein